MRSINLILGCHSHQPVGNFYFVFSEALEKSYLPFVEVLERYPDVHMTLHYSGPLFDWFLEEHPEFIARIAGLVHRGQVEIMGGGYYEPLLCAVPQRDARAQIARMQTFCEAHFGQAPRGMWLTERVWEPHLASTLAQAGIEYTALDDTQFQSTGVSGEALFGSYVTEDEGHPLTIFPILKTLRYLVPFHPVSETINFLREHATEDGLRCAVLHDDGEKFGVWPGTFDSVYTQGWLEQFFQALCEHSDWLHTVTYAEYRAKAKPVGRVYLPCASYKEMMTWAMPTVMQREFEGIEAELEHDAGRAEQLEPFLRGGFWRNFLVKYPEANNLHKRMLRVSARIATMSESYAGDCALVEATSLLHQGQCNCPYWHGVFGGLYLNHLRSAIYEKLIAADALLDGLEHAERRWVTCERCDFDRDGQDEAILENDQLSLFFSPGDGGTLFELDYKPKPFNFSNTLARRDEPYHDALRNNEADCRDEESGVQNIHGAVRVKEENLSDFLAYDAFRVASLRDHLFATRPAVSELLGGTCENIGPFVMASYRLATEEDAVQLTAEESIGAEAGHTMKITKRITLAPGASHFEIRYDIECAGAAETSEEGTDCLFGVAFAINFLTGASEDRYYESHSKDFGKPLLGVAGCNDGINDIALCDRSKGLAFGLIFSEATRVYRYPIETVSQSEGGQERVYQGSVVMPCWALQCVSGARFSQVIRVEICRQGTE